MAFSDSFHEIAPGYRINGRVMVSAIKTVKEGGLGDGSPMLLIGSFGIPGRTFIQAAAGERIPSGMTRVDDVAAMYEALELSGMSTVISGVLVNPSAVALLEYDTDSLIAKSLGAGGTFTFKRDDTRGQWERVGEDFLVPGPSWDSFLEAVLKRLSTVSEIVAQAANSYIALDGSNDYIEFTGKGAKNTGLLDWDADWSIGINLMDFEVKSDGQYITLFKSGDNAILLRRGGTNYGLYVTGNNGATKIGANTWYAPEAGGKLLFTYDGTTSKRLAYYIGKPDGGWNQRANYLVNTTNIGGNTPGTEFCIGKPVANSLYYHGGLNNLITADEKLAGPIISEYFSIQETYDQGGFYADLSTWAKLGEDPFPTVVDTLGDLTGGELINGNEADFVVIETPGEATEPDPSVPVVGTTIAYTPNSTSYSSFYGAESSQNYGPASPLRTTFGINQIEIDDTFFTIHFTDATKLATWRSIGRSVDLNPADTSKVWKGTKILAASTEFGVNSFANYVRYYASTLFSNSTNASDFSFYLADAGAGNTVCDFTFE